ncbi:MAG: TonB-dependent receptor, partial [Bacteroidales bacterium]|nr:TonB-dependent receptor [Bacteroidales bacterium]
DYYNPVSMINESKGSTEATLLRLLGDITYTPIQGLDFKAIASSNVWNQMSGYYETHQHTYEARTPKGGAASRTANRGQQDLLEITGQWKSRFAEDHNYTVLAGYSYLRSEDQSFSANNSGFAVDDYEYNNLGVGTALQQGVSSGKPVGMSSSKGENSLVSFFGRVNYDFKGRYMLAASIRREASTKFGENYKWGNFYSVSGAWNVKQESFLKDYEAISSLKLRAGYGETGTEPSSRYMSLNTLSFSNYAFYNGAQIQTLRPSTNANPNLRWERKHELNVGLDFGFFDDRLTGTIDWYNRKTLDLLWDYSVPCPPYIYSSMTANAGSMQNTGIEIGLSWQVIRNKDFMWTTSVNYSHNKNTLLALGNDQFMANDYSDQGFAFSTTSHRLQVGESIGNFWGFKSIDVDDAGHWIIEGEDGKPKSINDQQPTDKRVIGNALPKHYLNWNNNIQWKGFDLDVQMRGAFGFQVLNMTAGMYGIPCQLAMGNLLKRAFDPVYGKRVLADDQGYQYVSYFVENGDYWKIDNITLGYTFNVNSKSFKSLRVFGVIRNALTITGYSGNDPEVPITGLTPGMDHYYRYPITRSYTAGVSFKF